MITKKAPEPWPPEAEAGGGGSRFVTHDVLADENPRRRQTPAAQLAAESREMLRALRALAKLR